MLAVSCGPLHTKIAQNVAHFHAADADEEREAALLALAELAKDISKSRVPELLAGIWRCGLFSPDGRLTLFGRRTYQHFLHLGFLDFDLSALYPDLLLSNEAGDLTKRPDTADSAEKAKLPPRRVIQRSQTWLKPTKGAERSPSAVRHPCGSSAPSALDY